MNLSVLDEAEQLGHLPADVVSAFVDQARADPRRDRDAAALSAAAGVPADLLDEP